MDTNLIIKTYHETRNTVKTSRICHCHHRDVGRILKENGVELYRHKKYLFDNHFFDKINTEAKAYFLGFLWADGNNNRLGTLTLKITIEDTYILEKFNEIIGSKRPLKIITNIKCFNKKQQKTYLAKDAILLSLSNKKMLNTLESIGFIPNKSKTLLMPKDETIPDYLLHHFIRGYFDGDGTISKRIPKNRNKYIFSVGFCMKNYELGKQINLILKNIGLTHLIFRPSDTIYKIDILSMSEQIKFKEWLYKDATLFLKRKYEKFLQLEQRHKEHLNIRTSKYRGISIERGLFLVRKCINKKVCRLGVFSTEKEALECLKNHGFNP